MSLAHALLTSLAEKPGTGFQLARRFARSIGFFWAASHQQIYRELARMAGEGWIEISAAPAAEAPPPDGAPAAMAAKPYQVTQAGLAELMRWVCADNRETPLRDALSVRLRAAALCPDPETAAAMTATLTRHLAERSARLAEFRRFEARDYPPGRQLNRRQQLQRLLLLKGIDAEAWEIGWTQQMLAAIALPQEGSAPPLTVPGLITPASADPGITAPPNRAA